jgi:hypothetical protein
VKPAYRFTSPPALPGAPEITTAIKLSVLEELLAKIETLERTVAEQAKAIDQLTELVTTPEPASGIAP